MNWLRKKDALIYLILISGVLLAKLYHREANSADLFWILQPTIWLVTLFSGISFDLVQEGYFMNTNQQVIIDKSCSGVNFMLITICMLCFSYLPKLSSKFLCLVCFVGVAYIFTIFVNACRIIQVIWSQDVFVKRLPWSPEMLHEMQGVLVYFFFLTILYLLSQSVYNYLMKKTYEKVI